VRPTDPDNYTAVAHIRSDESRLDATWIERLSNVQAGQFNMEYTYSGVGISDLFSKTATVIEASLYRYRPNRPQTVYI